MGTLSVRENLQFSAALRLPGHMTASDRKQRVERVIEILNLFSCADTKVLNFAKIMEELCFTTWLICVIFHYLQKPCVHNVLYLHLGYKLCLCHIEKMFSVPCVNVV